MKKLISFTHSLIWLIMVIAIFHLLFYGITGIFHWTIWVSAGLLFVELLTLLIFKGICPFTILAKKANPNYEDGEDLLIPRWLVKRNKEIFGTILLIAIILVLIRLIYW